MGLLVKQGILSFLAIILFNLSNLLSTFGKVPAGGWQLVLLLIVEYGPIYTLAPRFILSMREMYAHDVRGRREGGNDTGFGYAGQNGSVEGVEEIQMEARTTQAV
ncbi:hypothetical protein V8E55_003539 [Tylopilus felleus]